MLKRLYKFNPGSVAGLIPNSGIQFLDFGLPEEAVKQIKRSFWPETKENERDASGNRTVYLHPLEKDEEGEDFYYTLDGEKAWPDDEDVYTVNATDALNRLAGQWLPAPVFRQKSRDRTGCPEFDAGPSNWARIWISRLDEPDDEGNRWRIVLALDTLLVSGGPDNSDVAPRPEDADDNSRFKLVTDHRQTDRFIRTRYEAGRMQREWVLDWLRDAYLDSEMARRNSRQALTLDDLRYPAEHMAVYTVLLEALEQAVIPAFYFIGNQAGGSAAPVDVDLAIDVGNSRTCGIFIEDNSTAQRLDMSQTYRLELRDLSRPERRYAHPFESRVEFHPANFGRVEHSMNSGRPGRDAFWWPSPVRVGPEAAWLSGKNDGTHGDSGLSGPKRYLWDKASRPQPWVNNPGLLPKGAHIPAIRGPITSQLTESGELVKRDSLPGMQAKYCRSSIYTLMLAEIISHALSQINSPSIRSQRARANQPRHLRRIILTLPSATPVAEQKILRKRANEALKLVWRAMGWDRAEDREDGETNPVYIKKPEIFCNWDEATATHLVFLYNEITQKFQRSPYDYFSLTSRNGENGGKPALRVASMDMGGGTTDLMIIEHRIEGERTIHPIQLFREGFRLAGDDILKQVIEESVLMAIRDRMVECGVTHADNLLVDLFGGDREGVSQQDRSLRSQCVRQILHPAALALLEAYEKTDFRCPAEPVVIPLMQTIPADREPRREVIDYLEDAARRAGGRDFTLASVDLHMDADTMSGIIQGVVKQILLDLCDVVRAYDCDYLLLTGRPSRLPVLNELIRAYMPIPANRIISMDGYKVGNWYPFHSSSFRIEDPKTTAAVGAMLCYVCEGSVEGMIVRVHELKMRSTARYIGVMEIMDQILERNIAFSGIDLDERRQETSAPVKFEPPGFLGYRQFPLERWKTTPLYHLSYKNRRDIAGLRMPLTLVLERDLADEDEGEEKLEEFDIASIRDANDQDCDGVLGKPRLQTLRVETDQEAGYWLDSGVLEIKGRA